MAAQETSRAEGPWAEPIRIVLFSIWFAVLASWVELGVVADRVFRQHRVLFGMAERLSLWTDPRLLWIVPLVDTAVLLLPGLALALIARRWPGRTVSVFAVFTAAFLATASVLFNFTWLHRAAVLALAAGIGVQIARVASAHRQGFHRWVGRTVGWMVGLVLVLGLGVTIRQTWIERRRVASLPDASGPPNVLLIILDTVRAFSLSLYGYPRPTTPNLERLARQGVLFERAFVTAPWTLPSHASIFTGRFPHELTADFQSALDDTYPTLAEAMSAHGYSTAGFIANTGYCQIESGLARGFVHYEDFVLSPGQLLHASSIVRVLLDHGVVRRALGFYDMLGRKSAERVNHDFLAWLSGRDQRRPFFAFLNYMDAHWPYLPPPPYDLRYLGTRERGQRLVVARKGHFGKDLGPLMQDAYDGALEHLDTQIGELISELERRGALRNTIVIIGSDHGEQFGEHGMYQHSNSLYTQLLQVPLLMFGTDRIPPGVTVRAPVSLREIPATILDLAPSDGPGPFPGQSLSRFWKADSSTQETPIPVAAELGRNAQLIEFFAPHSDGIRAVLAGGLHYIKNWRSGKSGQTTEELYDFDVDPTEKRDLLQTEAGRRAIERLRFLLDSTLPPVPPSGQTALKNGH